METEYKGAIERKSGGMRERDEERKQERETEKACDGEEMTLEYQN